MSSKKSNKLKTPERDLKQEMSWKNNLFARYMLFRYSLALFFFVNVYWMMLLLYKTNVYIVLPFVVMILLVIGTAEQFKLYGKKEVSLKWTKLSLKAQIVASVVAIIFTLLPHQFSVAFPAFADNVIGRGFVAIMQVLGIMIALYNLKRADLVENKKDKFYYRFQQSFGKLS